MLQVPVHRDHILAGCLRKAGGQSRRLPKVAPQPHNRDLVIDGGDIGEETVSEVGTAVVHEYQFVSFTRSLHDRMQAVVHLHDIFFFIVKRHDD